MYTCGRKKSNSYQEHKDKNQHMMETDCWNTTLSPRQQHVTCDIPAKKTHQRTEPPENASKLSCGRGLQHAIQTGQHIWRKGVASYAAPTPTLFRYPVSTCFCLVGCPHSPSEAFWFKWMLQLVPKRLKLIHFSRGCGLFRRVRTALDVSAPPLNTRTHTPGAS